MKSIRIIRSIFILLILNSIILADSPITSTPFSAAYSEEKIVISATKAKGVITPELMEYLSKPNNPVDVKMAVINELGWETRIKNNAAIFSSFLVRKNRTKSEAEFLQKISGDELLSLAYLKAMDDYYEVTPAIKFADLALEKNPKSLTYNLVIGLIRAQKAMDDNWCEVFKIPNLVRQNPELTVDMKIEATEIIYKYTESYEEFCK